MSDRKIFVDSNIWLYAFIKQDDRKHGVASSFIRGAEALVISTQVVSEVSVNLLKKAGQTEAFIREMVSGLYESYAVFSLTELVYLRASELRGGYSLSYWDSLICASALTAGCTELISEDMQHGLLIDNQLRIVNPFLG